MPHLFSVESMQKATESMSQLVGGYLPSVLAALIILVAGWLVALLIAAIVRTGLRKTGLNDRLGRWFVSEPGEKAPEVDRCVAKGVFYLLMLFVLVAFFQTLGLTLVTQPLTVFLNQLFEYAPRLLGAGVVLLFAWLVAIVLRLLTKKILTAVRFDRRLNQQTGGEDEEPIPVTKTLAEAVYWLVFLLFLPAVLDALAIPGLLAPVQDMVGKLLGFLPNLFAGFALLVIGWFVARIVQRIVANLLAAVGIDQLSERVGLSAALGKSRLSAVLGLIVYALILIPVIVAALNALAIEAVTRPASEMLNTLLAALPGILAAVLVVAIAYVVGRVVATLATSLLTGVGFDRLFVALGVSKEPVPGKRTPSEIVGTLVMVAVVFFAVMQAMPLLGFDLMAGLLAQFLVFAGHVVMGLVIFTLGLYLAKLISDTIRSTGMAQANLMAVLARIAVLVFAGAMGLKQMGLADDIVNLAFGLTLGAIAVAAAIAFGVGGRDAAKNVIEDMLKKQRQIDRD